MLSPAINRGCIDTTGLNLPLTDLAGNSRIVCNRIDIGAYETQTPRIGLVDFEADKTRINVNSQVVFTDFSCSNPIGWMWHFGDGQTSNMQHPTHTYNNVGKHNVSLVSSYLWGNDTLSKVNYITVDHPLSVDSHLNTENSIKIFPNPTNNYVEIQIHENISDFSLKMIDLYGKLIYFKDNVINNGDSFRINIDNYSKGLYLIEIKSKNNKWKKKIVKY